MRKKRLFSKFILLIFLAILGYGGYLFFEDRQGPSITLTPNTGYISPQSELTLDISDTSKVRSVEVLLRYNNQTIPVFSKHFDPYLPTQRVQFTFKNVPVPQGKFELELKAKDASFGAFGLGNSTVVSIPVVMDSEPPIVDVQSSTATVYRGGTGVIRYAVNEEMLSHGIYVGDHLFKGYLLNDADKKVAVCYFAFPHTMKVEDFKPILEVKDRAGNVTNTQVPVRVADRKFKEDTIKITDNFLNRVSQKLYDLAPNAANPLERFLIINSDIRKANTTFLRELGQTSDNTTHWSGSFMRLPRSASRAGYGEYRSYVYKDKVIDNQWHLGYDLASIKRDKIPAANAGKVVYTGNLGIYGNLVVIDHGFGLMSLYSHLTDILTSKDKMVQRGDIIGTTGISGMAFGDHVHFGILVGGIEVTPLEWLDANWIKNNITRRIDGKQ